MIAKFPFLSTFTSVLGETEKIDYMSKFISENSGILKLNQDYRKT